MKVASVLIPLPVPEAFDYEVAADMAVERGDQVAVPLGPRLMRGIVSEVRETTGSNAFPTPPAPPSARPSAGPAHAPRPGARDAPPGASARAGP